MITLQEVKDKTGVSQIDIDSLPDELWNKLDEAMFLDDWEGVQRILDGTVIE